MKNIEDMKGVIWGVMSEDMTVEECELCGEEISVGDVKASTPECLPIPSNEESKFWHGKCLFKEFDSLAEKIKSTNLRENMTVYPKEPLPKRAHYRTEIIDQEWNFKTTIVVIFSLRAKTSSFR